MSADPPAEDATDDEPSPDDESTPVESPRGDESAAGDAVSEDEQPAEQATDVQVSGDATESSSNDLADSATDAVSVGDDETPPAEAFGMRVGLLLAVVAIGGLFVGPAPLFVVEFGGGPFVVALNSGVGFGPLPYIAGAGLITGITSGFVYTAGEVDPDVDYRGQLSIGLVVPTALLTLVLAVLVLFSPAVHYALAGQFIRAFAVLTGVSVLVALGLTLFRVTAIVTLLALLYLALPTYVGVWFGSLFARVAGLGNR